MEKITTEKQPMSFAQDWTILLSDVLLFASAINCLFQTLAYFKTFDMVLFALSLILALFVYFKAVNPKNNPIVKTRIIIALVGLVVWAISIPLLHLAF